MRATPPQHQLVTKRCAAFVRKTVQTARIGGPLPGSRTGTLVSSGGGSSTSGGTGSGAGGGGTGGTSGFGSPGSSGAGGVVARLTPSKRRRREDSIDVWTVTGIFLDEWAWPPILRASRSQRFARAADIAAKHIFPAIGNCARKRWTDRRRLNRFVPRWPTRDRAGKNIVMRRPAGGIPGSRRPSFRACELRLGTLAKPGTPIANGSVQPRGTNPTARVRLPPSLFGWNGPGALFFNRACGGARPPRCAAPGGTWSPCGAPPPAPVARVVARSPRPTAVRSGFRHRSCP